MKIKRIFQKTLLLAQHKSSKDAILLTGSSGLTQLLTLSSAPILLVLYSPSNVGIYGVYLSIAAIFASYGTLRTEFALLSTQTSLEEARILDLSLLASFTASVISLIPMFIFCHSKLLPIDIIVGSLAIFLQCIGKVIQYCCLKQGYFRLISFSKLIASTFSTVLLLLLHTLGASALIVSSATSAMLALVIQICGTRSVVLHWLKSLRFSNFRLIRSWTTILKYHDYVSFGTASAAFNSLGNQLITPLLNYLFGSSAAGIYFICEKLSIVPASVVSTSISSVLLHRYSAKSRDSSILLNSLMRLLRITLSISVLYVLLYLLPVSMFTGSFVPAEWRPALSFMPLLSPYSIGIISISSLSTMLIANRLIKEDMQGQLIQSAFRIAPLAIVAFSSNISFSAAVFAYSTICLISYIAYFAKMATSFSSL